MSHTFNYAGFYSIWHQSDKKYGNEEDIMSDNFFVQHPEVTRYILEHEKHSNVAVEEPERWLPVIPADFILHDADHPFCYSSLCPCHDEEQEDNKALFLESVEQPIQDGLLTEHEGYCLHWGEIV